MKRLATPLFPLRASSVRRQRGFTMVEMIIVITITAIVAAMMYVFIRMPVQAYSDTVARAAASDEADTVMRRIARDVRLALPNSIRVGGGGAYLEYLETTAGLRYQSEDDIDATLDPAKYLNWNAGTLEFAVIGGVPAGRHRPVAGNYLVVYNLGEGQEPANAYNCDPGIACNRATIGAVSSTSITMVANPFPAQTAAGLALKSPSHRAQVVTGPVTYFCNAATRQLWRYSGYAIARDQAVTLASMPPPGARAGLLASNVDACDFRYDSGGSLSSQRSALLGIRLTLGINGQSQGRIQLEHQVHVDNTP